MVRVEQQCKCTYCHWTVQLNMIKIVYFILGDFYHNKKYFSKIQKCFHACVLSGVQLCNPLDCSPQAPLSTGSSRQEDWSGCHFLLQGIFLTQGLYLNLLSWQADSLATGAIGEAPCKAAILVGNGPCPLNPKHPSDYQILQPLSLSPLDLLPIQKSKAQPRHLGRDWERAPISCWLASADVM